MISLRNANGPSRALLTQYPGEEVPVFDIAKYYLPNDTAGFAYKQQPAW